MISVNCSTQAEVDAAAAAGNIAVVTAGIFVARGSATVYARGSATVYASDSATVDARGSATVYASGYATVYARGSATVYASGYATVYARDSATVYEASTKTPLRRSRPVVLLGPIGSRNDMLSVYQCDDGGILIRAGCFLGRRDEFAAAVAQTHKSGQYADEYRAALAFIDSLLEAAK